MSFLCFCVLKNFLCLSILEHEITGDVLLELDGSMLKEEMGITALGKRMRIQNGIVEIKRPISGNMNNLTSMPMPTPLPMSGSVSVSSASSFGHVQGQGHAMMMGGVPQQQMYNFNGIPVPGVQMPQPPAAAVYAGQVSPQGYSYPNAGAGYGNGNGSGRTPSIESPLNMPGTGSPYAGSVISEEFSSNGPAGKDSPSGLQLPVCVIVNC